MRASLMLALTVLGPPLAAEVSITPVGDHVSVRAVSAPLSEVLDQLARRTGIKVTYEGSHPRQPVTLTVEDRTTVQAVLAVLEGQGLNFGLRMDASGTRVDRLLVLGLAPAGGSSGTASTPHAAQPQPPMQVLPQIVEEDQEPPEIDQPDPEPPPGLSIPLPGPAGRRPGGPPSRGQFQNAPQNIPPQPQPDSSLSGGSPFAPRPAQPLPFPPPQPPQKEEQPN